MPEKCIHHPGRKTVVDFAGKGYCQKCRAGQQDAVQQVDKHITPADCFVWYVGRDTWEPIGGTGCAHWVAHEKGLKAGSGEPCCLGGYVVRVPDLVNGKTRIVDLIEVRPGDIYANSKLDHCGLVVEAMPDPQLGAKISIKHDSSRQGGVFVNDFHSHFKGRGYFYR